jgi:hypothetical protein
MLYFPPNIRNATYNDIKKVKETVDILIEQDRFYFDYQGENDKNEYKLNDENYIKELLDRGDLILIYEENGKIYGISHWSIKDGIYWNEYTGVIRENGGKNIGKQFYYVFLNENIPIGAEFITYTVTSSKIFNIWYEKGTKVYGFSAAQQYYNNTNNFSTIIGFRPKENKVKLKVPSYSENYIKKLCLLNNLDCKISVLDFERNKNNEKNGKIILSNEMEKYEKSGWYLTGFIFNNDILYIYTNKIDSEGVKNIMKFFDDFKKNEYMERIGYTILEYIDVLKKV